MATPGTHTKKPITRSSTKNPEEPRARRSSVGSSPVLAASSKKRKLPADQDPSVEEPLAKRMADNQLLEAINGIKNSVAAMEQQMRSVPSKADLGALVTEMRGIKETVIRNKDRIDTLYDMRKSDGEILANRVEQIVERKIAVTADSRRRKSAQGSENKRSLLRSRRSVRLWPVRETGGLKKGVKTFLNDCLKIPFAVIEGLVFQKIEKQSQAR